MRVGTTLVFGCLLCVAVLAGQALSVPDTDEIAAAKKELIQLEHDWTKASMTRDRAWLESFIADEATLTHPTSGTIKNKAREVADTVAAGQAVEEMTLSHASATVFGSPPTVGVVTGRSSESGGGGHLTDRHRVYLFTDTFLKRGGRWQLVASHSSRVAE